MKVFNQNLIYMRTTMNLVHDTDGNRDRSCYSVNSELKILGSLIDFITKKITAHIYLPFMVSHADLDPFISTLPSCNGSFFRKPNNNCGTILLYMYDCYTPTLKPWLYVSDFIAKYMVKEIDCKIIIFQILYTLAHIQKKYESFRHNNLRIENIILFLNPSIDNDFDYVIDKTSFAVPKRPLHCMIMDFTASTIDGIVENEFLMKSSLGLTTKKNRYYDVHFFLFDFLTYYKENNDRVHTSVIDFIYRVIPDKYRENEFGNITHGRLKTDDEYTTAEKIIIEDDFFAEFRFH